MFTSYRNIMARKAAGEMDESGFTLIELLIVIVVLGILAGVVVFALGGVTGQSAVASCKADGATIQTAMSAFSTDNPQLTVSQTGLTASANSGPFLQSWPSNNDTHYAYTIDPSGVLQLAIGTTAAAPFTGPTMCNSVL